MNNINYDEYDAICVRCNKGISFNVGFDLNICPYCGGNYTYTDEQLAQQKIDNERQAKAAERTMRNDRNKVEFLHNLKEQYPDKIAMLDEIMDDVSFIEAAAVREGRPSLLDLGG